MDNKEKPIFLYKLYFIGNHYSKNTILPIRKVEIDRMTDDYVWEKLSLIRERKETKLYKYFDNVEDAKKRLLFEIERKLDYHKKVADGWQARYDELQALTEIHE